jgi:hypothetical protein
MTISIAIGSDPKDIENLKKIRQIINKENVSDTESVKEWVDDLYFLLTNYKHFANF